MALLLTSCGTAVNVSDPHIASHPVHQIVTEGEAATFTVSASGTMPISYQWQRDGADISGANSESYMIPATDASYNGSAYRVLVSNSMGSVTSKAATLTVTVTSGAPTPASVLTYHNDAARTGQNLSETALTPANVRWETFGKTAFLNAAGEVNAQPLYVPNLMVGGASHNVLFVATEKANVYAFDADDFSLLWQKSLLGPGESPSDDRSCKDYSPEIGITSTPVIDPEAGANGTIFLVAMSKDGGGNYYQRLHALDLTTGAAQPQSPTAIQATFPNLSGQTVFDPKQYSVRAALLLLDGTIYMGWSSHCDHAPYTGWVMAYDSATLVQTSVLNITPNGSEGGIWMSGGGLAADASENIYLIVGNGTFDTTLNASGFPSKGDYGNAVLKISTSGGTLGVADYFTMYNTVNESEGDQDFGSGGVLLLPDLQDASSKTVHLALAAGKDRNIYVLNRNSLGKFMSDEDSVYQKIGGALAGGVFSTPAYYRNTVYYGAVKDVLRAFPVVNAKLPTVASSYSTTEFGYPGTTPGISANGSSNGIVWAVKNGSTAVLYAYDANNLEIELYNSNEAADGRDHFAGNKFITPTISNGKVYVGTPTGVAVFGLLK